NKEVFREYWESFLQRVKLYGNEPFTGWLWMNVYPVIAVLILHSTWDVVPAGCCGDLQKLDGKSKVSSGTKVPQKLRGNEQGKRFGREILGRSNYQRKGTSLSI